MHKKIPRAQVNFKTINSYVTVNLRCFLLAYLHGRCNREYADCCQDCIWNWLSQLL
ncbi:MAG: hypothetical protein ACFFC7_35035 [Candidatus Hermodarchaeota archaeon]